MSRVKVEYDSMTIVLHGRPVDWALRQLKDSVGPHLTLYKARQRFEPAPVRRRRKSYSARRRRGDTSN
jgi:ribosomal protein S21